MKLKDEMAELNSKKKNHLYLSGFFECTDSY